MKTKKIFFVILSAITLVTFLYGCKKNKLNGDMQILIGKWNWNYSDYTYNKCSKYSSIHQTLTPISENKNFSIEFDPKGFVTLFENNSILQEGRIHFEKSHNNNSKFYFQIFINRNTANSITGSTDGSILSTSDFPYKGEEPSCDDYINYFTIEI